MSPPGNGAFEVLLADFMEQVDAERRVGTRVRKVIS